MSTETHQHSLSEHKTARRGGIAAIAIVAGCAIACSLPLLIGIGAVSSIGAFLGGWEVAGIALTAAVAGAGVWLLVRRQRAAARRAQAANMTDGASEASGCGCGSC
jgi:hypothetical protein